MKTKKERSKAVLKAVSRAEDSKDREPLLTTSQTSAQAQAPQQSGSKSASSTSRSTASNPGGRKHHSAKHALSPRPPPPPSSQDQDLYGASGDALYMGVDRRALMNTGPDGLSSDEAAYRLERFGKNEITEKKENKWLKLAKEFKRPMALMVWVAVVVEAMEAVLDSPSYWADVGVLVTLQMVNCLLGWSEEIKAQDAVAALKQSLQPEATVIRDGKWALISATLVVPGDRVLISSGAAVPADCLLSQGQPIQVDQAALTGESLPKTMYPADQVLMGSTCTRGECQALVAATAAQTFFGRTAALLKLQSTPGNFELLLRRITVLLTGGGVVVVLITFIFLLSQQEPVLKTVAFCVVLLVASIPIAMRVVCTTTMALGSRQLAQEKAIVTRLSAVEDIAGMTVLCSDKTGTLTLNQMRLQKEMPLFCEGVTRHDVLVAAALATRWKEPPKDALDTLVLTAIDLSPLDMYEQIDHVPFDTSIKRTEATLRRKDGSIFRVTKGAPNVLLGMAYNADEIKPMVDEQVVSLGRRGVRTLGVACSSSQEEGWVFMGLLTFLDPPRPDSAATIKQARAFGVKTKMITGDHGIIAVEMCNTLGMGTNVLGPERLPSSILTQSKKTQSTGSLLLEDGEEDEVSQHLGRDYGGMCEAADGFAQVLPEHKFVIVEALRQRGHVVGMTGDGVNDAPALKRADVGIAVQGATDAARAASDVVLTEPGLGTIVRAIVVSRQIVQRMKNYLIFRVACTIQLLMFFFVSCLFFSPKNYHQAVSEGEETWPDVFDLPVIAVVIITILNDGTIISIAYDSVRACKLPEHWNLKALSLAASVIGFTAMVSSLVLLDLCLNSNSEGSFLEGLGLGYLSFGEIQMMLFMKISLSNFLSVFCARTTSWCWSRPPGTLMVAAVTAALLLTTLLSAAWPFKDELRSLNASQCLFVWFFVLFWFAVQDTLKVGAYKVLNFLGYMEEAEYINEQDFIFSSQFENNQNGEVAIKSARASRRRKAGSRVVDQLKKNQPQPSRTSDDIEDGLPIEL